MPPLSDSQKREIRQLLTAAEDFSECADVLRKRHQPLVEYPRDIRKLFSSRQPARGTRERDLNLLLACLGSIGIRLTTINEILGKTIKDPVTRNYSKVLDEAKNQLPEKFQKLRSRSKVELLNKVRRWSQREVAQKMTQAEGKRNGVSHSTICRWRKQFRKAIVEELMANIDEYLCDVLRHNVGHWENVETLLYEARPCALNAFTIEQLLSKTQGMVARFKTKLTTEGVL